MKEKTRLRIESARRSGREEMLGQVCRFLKHEMGMVIIADDIWSHFGPKESQPPRSVRIVTEPTASPYVSRVTDWVRE